MADSDTIDNAGLYSDIQQTIESRVNGLYNIVTNKNLAILIGVTSGNITRLYCRSLPPNEVIEVLRDSRGFRVNFVSATEDTNKLVMSGADFLRCLDQDEIETTSAPADLSSDVLQTTFKPQLEELASEYIGIAATFLVDDAFDKFDSVEKIIHFTRNGIPDHASATEFEEKAREVLALIID